MFANFQSLGRRPSLRGLLKSLKRREAISSAFSLRILVVIPSGPVALFGFKLRRISSISEVDGVTSVSDGSGCVTRLALSSLARDGWFPSSGENTDAK